MSAENIFAVALLALTSILILAMVVVLVAVQRQSRRISRLAEQMHELALHAEEANEEPAPPASQDPDRKA